MSSAAETSTRSDIPAGAAPKQGEEEEEKKKKKNATPLLITGDDNGLVKVWDLTKPSPVPKVTFGQQTPGRAVQALCWSDRDCTQVIASFADGTTIALPTTPDAAKRDNAVLAVDRGGISAASASSMAVVGDRLIMVTKDDGVFGLDIETGTKDKCLFNYRPPKERRCPGDRNPDELSIEDQEIMFAGGRETTATLKPSTIIEASHIHRKFSLVATGGKNNDLCVWDISHSAVQRGSSKKDTPPLFMAENVDSHVLGVAYPTYVTGCCIVDYHVFTTVTAYHQVRFYDRRLGRKPVQEFAIDREISRRPTAVLQWNSNKYLIGEAGGDVHLYDTRRGFSSRAKLRGADGSIRSISKHPDGLPLVATAGLDRTARIFHVPTGKQIQQMHLKQMGTCCLLSRGSPAQLLGAVGNEAADWVTAGNSKQNAAAFTQWDDLMPVADDINEADDDDENNNTSAAAAAKSAAASEEAKSAGTRRNRVVGQ